jgi:hypothetical protein
MNETSATCKKCGKLELPNPDLYTEAEYDLIACACPLAPDHVMAGTFKRGWVG